MKIAIVIPTYFRSDGSTPFYLDRAVQSIIDQKHEDWKIFLIGDRFEQPETIQSILDKIPVEKLYFRNLQVAKERDANYPKEMLWKYGGVNATNFGIMEAMRDGFEWVAHLDHDDTWTNAHLFEINHVIENPELKASWICTVSKYKNDNTYLPLLFTHLDVVRFEPTPEKLIRSSVCMNFSDIPLRYLDLYLLSDFQDPKTLPGLFQPSDANLWERCADYIQRNDLKSYCINKCTVIHLEEGFELNK